MTLKLSSQKDFNQLVKTLTSNLNTNINLRDMADGIGRREVERSLAPALSGGKSHPAYIAELKALPKSKNGVIATLAQPSLSRKLATLSKEIEEFRVYKKDSIAPINTTKKLWAEDSFTDLINQPSTPSILSEFHANLLSDVNANNTSIVVHGLDEPHRTYDGGACDYEMVIELTVKGMTLAIEAEVECSGEGRNVVSFEYYRIGGEDLHDLFDNQEVAEQFESPFMEWLDMLLFNSLLDLSCDITTSISTELLILLAEELKDEVVKVEPRVFFNTATHLAFWDPKGHSKAHIPEGWSKTQTNINFHFTASNVFVYAHPDFTADAEAYVKRENAKLKIPGEMKILFKDLQDLISEARDSAESEASRGSKFVKSRGVWLRAARGNEPANESEETFLESKAVLIKFVNALAAEGVDSISIEGGFDGGEHLTDWADGNYEPWVSEWCFDIWNSKDKWIDEEFISKAIDAQNEEH